MHYNNMAHVLCLQKECQSKPLPMGIQITRRDSPYSVLILSPNYVREPPSVGVKGGNDFEDEMLTVLPLSNIFAISRKSLF